ncbi:MAG: hypothetical protein OXI96_07835 [Acidimicrobiaceae bacterium]|nr:hypothetical protein [Acidimicrobiaceae bacterium]
MSITRSSGASRGEQSRTVVVVAGSSGSEASGAARTVIVEASASPFTVDSADSWVSKRSDKHPPARTARTAETSTTPAEAGRMLSRPASGSLTTLGETIERNGNTGGMPIP